MVVHVNHAIARSACRSCRINLADLLLLSAHFQVDLMFINAFSYRYFRTGKSQLLCRTLESLAVILRRFDEGVNAQLRNTYHRDLTFRHRGGQTKRPFFPFFFALFGLIFGFF